MTTQRKEYTYVIFTVGRESWTRPFYKRRKGEQEGSVVEVGTEVQSKYRTLFVAREEDGLNEPRGHLFTHCLPH